MSSALPLLRTVVSQRGKMEYARNIEQNGGYILKYYNNQSGFTVLELIIILLMLGIMLALVFWL